MNCIVMIQTGLPVLKQHRIPSGATVSKVKCTICSQYVFLGMLAKEQMMCCSTASQDPHSMLPFPILCFAPNLLFEMDGNFLAMACFVHFLRIS